MVFELDGHSHLCGSVLANPKHTGLQAPQQCALCVHSAVVPLWCELCHCASLPRVIYLQYLRLKKSWHAHANSQITMLGLQPPPVPVRGNPPGMATQQTTTSEVSGQFTVLLVEDDMCTRTLVASLLTKCSYKGDSVPAHANPARGLDRIWLAPYNIRGSRQRLHYNALRSVAHHYHHSASGKQRTRGAGCAPTQLHPSGPHPHRHPHA